MIELIGLSCISVLFVVAEPMIMIKRYLGFKEEEYDNLSKNKRMLFRLLTCAMCISFWIGFIYTLSLYKASIISIISELIYRKIKE